MAPGGVPGQGGWPPHAPQQPEAPRKRKGRGCLISVLVVVVLVLGAAGTGAWFLLGFGQGKVQWTQEFTSRETDTQNYLATWFTDKHVVRAQLDGAVGLDPTTGGERWKVHVRDTSDDLICAASSVSSEGIAVLAYGERGYCTNVFAVDMEKGKKLWDKPLKKDTREQPSLAVAKGTVVVDNQNAYHLRDGSKVWSNSKLVRGGKACSEGSYVGGEKLIRTQSCDVQKDDLGDLVSARHITSEISPQTGKILWTYSAENKYEEEADDPNGDILSTSPVVVRETEGAYRILDGKGEPQGLVDVKGGDDMGKSGAAQQGSPDSSVMSAEGTLAVEQRASGDKEAIDAFDIDSGKKLWSVTATDSVSYDLAQTDDDRLMAVKYDKDALVLDSAETRPFSLVEFDPRGGEETEFQDYAGVGDSLGVYAMPYVRENTLFLASFAGSSSVGELAEDGLGVSDSHENSLVALSL